MAVELVGFFGSYLVKYRFNVLFGVYTLMCFILGGGPCDLSDFRGSSYLRPAVTGRLFPPSGRYSLYFPVFRGIFVSLCVLLSF